MALQDNPLFLCSCEFLRHNCEVVVAFLPDSNEWTVKRIFVEDQGAKVILIDTNGWTVKRIFVEDQGAKVILIDTNGWKENFEAEQVVVQGVVEDVVKNLNEVDRIVKSVKEIEDIYFD